MIDISYLVKKVVVELVQHRTAIAKDVFDGTAVVEINCGAFASQKIEAVLHRICVDDDVVWNVINRSCVVESEFEAHGF